MEDFTIPKTFAEYLQIEGVELFQAADPDKLMEQAAKIVDFARSKMTPSELQTFAEVSQKITTMSHLPQIRSQTNEGGRQFRSFTLAIASQYLIAMVALTRGFEEISRIYEQLDLNQGPNPKTKDN